MWRALPHFRPTGSAGALFLKWKQTCVSFHKFYCPCGVGLEIPADPGRIARQSETIHNLEAKNLGLPGPPKPVLSKNAANFWTFFALMLQVAPILMIVPNWGRCL